MKEKNEKIKVVSFNLANWAWKLSTRKHSLRLYDNIEAIKKSICGMEEDSIICLQEFIVGKNFRYVLRFVLHFPEHVMRFPKGYDNSRNYSSAITVMLVPKKYNYKELELPISAERKWLRYNYIEIEGACLDKPIRIMNVHLPHLNLEKAAAWYANCRKKERENYIAAIHQVIDENNTLGIPCAVVGDYNTLAKDEDFVNLIEFYDMEDIMPDAEKSQNTWENNVVGGKNRIDYICINKTMLKHVQIENAKVDRDPIDRVISDHALLSCEFIASI